MLDKPNLSLSIMGECTTHRGVRQRHKFDLAGVLDARRHPSVSTEPVKTHPPTTGVPVGSSRPSCHACARSSLAAWAGGNHPTAPSAAAVWATSPAAKAAAKAPTKSTTACPTQASVASCPSSAHADALRSFIGPKAATLLAVARE
jgi:hypothetical protein